MTTFSDDYIDYWGKVYNATPIIMKRGIQFDTFLLKPQQFLHLVKTEGAEPLLPPQQAVMHDLAEAEHDALIPATAQRRGPSFIERLKHHCWTPRKHRRVSA